MDQPGVIPSGAGTVPGQEGGGDKGGGSAASSPSLPPGSGTPATPTPPSPLMPLLPAPEEGLLPRHRWRIVSRADHSEPGKGLPWSHEELAFHTQERSLPPSRSGYREASWHTHMPTSFPQREEGLCCQAWKEGPGLRQSLCWACQGPRLSFPGTPSSMGGASLPGGQESRRD